MPSEPPNALPSDLSFRSKPELACELLDQVLGWGVPPLPLVTDSFYGDSYDFRQQLQQRQLKYVVTVEPQTQVWTQDPQRPAAYCQTPRPPPPGADPGRAAVAPGSADGRWPAAAFGSAQRDVAGGGAEDPKVLALPGCQFGRHTAGAPARGRNASLSGC